MLNIYILFTNNLSHKHLALVNVFVLNSSIKNLIKNILYLPYQI